MNTCGNISERVGNVAVAKLLARAQPNMPLQRFAQFDTQEKNAGLTRTWRRYSTLGAIQAPSVEGVTPAGQQLRYTNHVARLRQYIGLVEISDVIADTHEDPVLNEALKLISEQFAETMEVAAWGVVLSGTNVFLASAAANRAAVNAPISRSDIRRVVRALEREKARPITEIVAASAGFNTSPVEAAYFAVCHPDLIPDLRGITGFSPVSEYGSRGSVVPGEIGAVEQVRFVRAHHAAPWLQSGNTASTAHLAGGVPPASAGACDVYPVMFFGRDAYAMARLQGRQGANVAVLNPGTPSHSDPAGQKGSVSWKTYFGGAITANEWMARLEVAVVANPA